MKTQPLDFILAALALGVILAADVAIVAGVLVPASTRWLGAYHVLVDAAALMLGFGLIAALLARGLLRFWPLSPGEYAMDHPVFVRWKLLTVIYEFGRGALLPFTTVFARPVVARLFGAHIGRDVAVGGSINEPVLVTIGDEAILGHNSLVSPHAINSGKIILREVNIGQAATIGANVVVFAGANIGEGAVVTANAVVSVGTRIPPHELWGGIPARKLKDIAPAEIRG